MNLHPHQHKALVLELSRPEYQALSANDAFMLLASDLLSAGMRRLIATRFLTQEELDHLIAKQRPLNETPVVIVTQAERDEFLTTHWQTICQTNERLPQGDRRRLKIPNCMPGMVNKMRREWFDLAWAEARS